MYLPGLRWCLALSFGEICGRFVFVRLLLCFELEFGLWLSGLVGVVCGGGVLAV